MAVPLPLHSTLAFEMIDQWKRLIAARADDRDRIGQAVYNVLEEAVECVRQSNDWLSAARCCDWGFAACQCDPTEAAVASGLTGQLRDLHFPKATVEFHRGVFLVGQSNLESAIEYFRMSARDFTHSQVLAPHSSSAAVGACLALWACGRVAFVQQDWGEALRAYENAAHLLDQRDARTHLLRQLIETEIQQTRQALRQYLRTQPSGARAHSRVHTHAVADPPVRRIPILARIAAGTPLPTGEGVPINQSDPDLVCGEIWVDAEHAQGAEFGLLVKGDSMHDAGMCNGDYALIRPQREANNGDIAAVMIIRQGDDDHATLKKYYREKDHWLLRPMNARYKPIVVVARDDRERIVREYARRNMDVEVKVDATVYVVGRVVAIWRAMG
jgi:SOS-response transcriptional repressor LexA